jgi:hypothetical protein
MPLARGIEQAVSARPDTNLFVLGNHGLVIGGEDAKEVEDLLSEVRRRLTISPRQVHPADYAALMEISTDSPWDLPEDDGLHALGTDAVCQAILKGGILYPCQTIFSDSRSPNLFHALGCPDPGGHWQDQHHDRPFLIIEGRGVLVRATLAPAGLAMLSGLAHVVRRMDVNTPLRYLTEAEVSGIRDQSAYRYRELSNSSRVPNDALASKPPSCPMSRVIGHASLAQFPSALYFRGSKRTSTSVFTLIGLPPLTVGLYRN